MTLMFMLAMAMFFHTEKQDLHPGCIHRCLLAGGSEWKQKILHHLKYVTPIVAAYQINQDFLPEPKP